MTPEELKAAAEVMRRAAEGEPVEGRHRGDGDWGVRPEPGWDWFYHEYRIAPPKPREWWGVANNDGVTRVDCPTREEAEQSLKYYRQKHGHGHMLVHITEVLP